MPVDNTNQIMWWGYRHINGTIQVKRFFSHEDIREAKQSAFVSAVCGPFLAEGREHALRLAEGLFDTRAQS